MPRTLCFDFGNSRLKAALFIEDKCIEHFVLPDCSIDTIDILLRAHKPTKTILSSVIYHNKEIEMYLAQHTKFHLLHYKSKLPITTAVGEPIEIGADRLAICAACTHLFPKQHTLAIALGTCITYNYVNIFQQFVGGSISPGLSMRFRAMHEHTALLPLVKPTKQFPIIAYNTKTHLQCGVQMGIAKEIDGIIKTYSEKFSNLQVVCTGGDVEWIAPYLQQKIHVEANLLFIGLWCINELNP